MRLSRRVLRKNSIQGTPVRFCRLATAISSQHVLRTALALLFDLLRLSGSTLRSRSHLAAENLFLRKQLACYVERQARPKRADNATRITLALLSRVVAWRELLTIVRPDTLVRWHRDLDRLSGAPGPSRADGRGFPPTSSD